MAEKVQTSHLRSPLPGLPAKLPRWFTGQSLARLAGYGVVAFIAWTLMSMVMPPVFSHSSQRAVVDVPTTLVTTPIEGVVMAQRLRLGDRFHTGDVLAEVQNQNVDRSTLVALTGKKVELAQQYDAVSAQLEASRARLVQTNGQIAKYQSAAQRMHAANVAAVQSKLAVANSRIDQQEEVVNRDSTLAAAGAISGAVSDASKYQLAELQSAKAAVQAELQEAEADSQASRSKVFFDSRDASVATMVHDREDLQNSIDQLAAQVASLQQSQSAIDQLIDKERDRVERMSSFQIKAYGDGVVKDILAPPGTQVGAGATLIRAVDCSRAQVIAVFPRSLSDDLLPGTRLQVHVDGVAHPLGASVAGLLPRATEGDQARYDVPFPPLESNEIYAVASFDRPLPAATAGKSAEGTCQVGRWAQVSLDRPWMTGLKRLAGHLLPGRS